MTLVSVVVLAYKNEPWLERSVRAALASRGVDVEVILVDNGCTDGAVDRLQHLFGVDVVRPPENLGFAGGCNAGALRAHGEVLALVNGDAVVAPDALARLAEVALEADVGIASASIRLAEAPEKLNSGGNELHFLGFAWSGAFGEDASAHRYERDIAYASGAGMAMKSALWAHLGGFDAQYFAYHEDAELSLRCWQQGLRIVYVPDAVVLHRYEFSRSALKYYLVERNRLALVLTLFEGRTLALLLPALATVELATLLVAVKSGWARQKLAGWRWLLRNRRWLMARRRRLQAERSVGDRSLASVFVSRLDAGNYPLPQALVPLDRLLGGYWSAVRRFL
ncbi:MAG: glycosyltransferase family 2 protein [Actinomycetota bacterium]|nr:glycosyltransferase family 2 protein [Actinomycetota bacterium]